MSKLLPYKDFILQSKLLGHGSRQIAKALGVSKTTVNDFIRSLASPEKDEATHDSVAHDNSRILFISDLHSPYQHENAVEWLNLLKGKYSPTRVICVGDELDKHAMSYHESNPDLYSAGHELEEAKKVMEVLGKYQDELKKIMA
jgi:DNA-binding LacI/PurR family transcriptional regulator